MEEKTKFWPILVLVLSICLIIIIGFYLYPQEKKVSEDKFGVSLTNLENSNNNQMASTTNEKVLLSVKTNQGDILLELYPEQAPKTVANFVKLSSSGFYNQTLFHRVIKDFMIQGGDPLSKDKDWSLHGTGGPGYKFEDEQNNIKLERGVIAMANSGPNTNGSQFFIMTARQPLQLAGYYTAFGRVVGGMETVDKIEAVSVNENDHPLNDVVIESVEAK